MIGQDCDHYGVAVGVRQGELLQPRVAAATVSFNVLVPAVRPTNSASQTTRVSSSGRSM